MIHARPPLPGWGQVFWQDNWRHLALKGGRGAGAKSRTIATAYLTLGTESVRRVLCGRETMRSMKDSVKALLDDTIARLRMGQGPGQSGFYTSTRDGIYGANGTRFLFAGLRTDPESVKSMEGLTDVWLEEARKISQESLDILEPTVRLPGSRLVYSYNARSPTDPVDAMFFGPGGPPPRSIVMHLQPEDNPWFPAVLREKMEWDKLRDYGRYLHIWRGEYWKRDDAKVFVDWDVAAFDTPKDAVLRFGADWGFSVDPTVLVRAFIGWWNPDTGEAKADPEGDTLFVDHEAWRVKCSIDDTPALFAGSDTGRVKARWDNPNEYPGVPGALRWPITADSARPETIAYMQARGFVMEPAIKGAGSIEDGVAFLQSYRIVVHERCRNTADELATYSYKVDPKTEQVLPVLADKDNNTIDALRYALEGVRRAGSGRVVVKSASPRATPLGHKPQGRVGTQLVHRETNTGKGWGSAPSRREGI